MALSHTALMNNETFEQHLLEQIPSRTHYFSCSDEVDSRESEGNQSSHHNYEVQNVPQVTKVRAVMEDQTLLDHLRKTQYVFLNSQYFTLIKQ